MRRLVPERADDFPKRGPRYDVFLALANLSGYLRKTWVIVTQEKLLERIKGNSGHAMSRRTLNRHLNGLERMTAINRMQRHQRGRYGELRLRATLYTFGKLGVLWIKRLGTSAAVPLGRPAVPKMAQSRNPIFISRCPHCGETIHSGDNGRPLSSPPRKRGGKRGPPTSTSTGRRINGRAARAHGKALSREEAQLLHQEREER